MMNNGNMVPCPGCGDAMRVQIDKLELNWAGDGPYVRDDGFAGILADVFCCGSCGRVAIRPVELGISRARAHAA